MGTPRIGIIGARRCVQGIGEYVARNLAVLGADVCAIAGTSQQSVAEAAESLQVRFDLLVRGYSSAERMMRDETLDAVAICSPHRFHREHLRLALESGSHVLCEKPFVFDSGRKNLADATEIAEGFANAGLVLMVNQQWPYTLPAFHQCHPAVSLNGGMDRLEMLLAPADEGIGMIPNAMPHVLSMLFSSMSVGGRVEKITFQRPGPGQLLLALNYVHESGEVRIRVRLVHGPVQPRPAGYAINGCTVLRRIDLATYDMFFESLDTPLEALDLNAGPQFGPSDHRGVLVPVEDPLRLLLADFIRRIETPENWSNVDDRILDNVRVLDDVYLAARIDFDG
ncbi:MAG: Gfo/Idh/MocA family oxidoreductase [Pirellulales bacterium]